jgi:hypothetical protein
MLECPFTKTIWHEVLAWLRMTARAPNGEDTLMYWWLQDKQQTPKLLHKGLAFPALLTPLG